MDRSLRFRVYDDELSALFRLAFATAPPLRLNLARHRNSPVHSSIGTPSHLHVLRLLVDIRFQVLFHSPPGVLFTFPSRYYTLSVAKKCFALEGGPPCFPQGFTCLVVLWIQSHVCKVSITGLSPSSAELSNSILLPHLHLMTVLNPGSVSRSGLGSSPFARRY